MHISYVSLVHSLNDTTLLLIPAPSHLYLFTRETERQIVGFDKVFDNDRSNYETAKDSRKRISATDYI